MTRFSFPRHPWRLPPVSQLRSLTCSPVFASMACSDSYGSMPSTPRTGALEVLRLSWRSTEPPKCTIGLRHEPLAAPDFADYRIPGPYRVHRASVRAVTAADMRHRRRFGLTTNRRPGHP